MNTTTTSYENTPLYEYVQKPALKSRFAKSVLRCANFYAKTENREQVKTIICSGIDDLGNLSKTILKTKEHGVGVGMVAILLPKTVQMIGTFIQAQEEEAKENAGNNKDAIDAQPNS